MSNSRAVAKDGAHRTGKPCDPLVSGASLSSSERVRPGPRRFGVRGHPLPAEELQPPHTAQWDHQDGGLGALAEVFPQPASDPPNRACGDDAGACYLRVARYHGPIARAHYLQVTEEHFAKAVAPPAPIQPPS